MQVRHDPVTELENVLLAVRKGQNLSHRGSVYAGGKSFSRTDKTYRDHDFQDNLINGNPRDVFDRMGERIQYLRQRDFDYYYQDDNGRHVLVKDNLNKAFEDLNPIHPDESEIQFLRYLRGMLLMAEHTNDKDRQGNLMLAVIEVYQSYRRTKYQSSDLPKLTLELAGVLVDKIKTIEFLKNDKEAGLQLTMARDVASMLETHPDTCTVASMNDSEQVSVSKSSMQRINHDYYETFFSDIEKQPWMQSAKRLQGMNPGSENWLSLCLRERLDELKSKGNPAVPSARWLPLPATFFHEEKITVGKGMVEYNDYVRTGVLIPFDVKKVPDLDYDASYAYQKEIAKQIVREVLRAHVPRNIERFKALYNIQPDQKFPFYVNYQTLLSPLIGEGGLNHTDNNARFVKLVGEVFHQLEGDQYFMRELAGDSGAEIKLTHTNSAINRNAGLTTSAMSERLQKFRQRFSSEKLEDTEHNKTRRERLETAKQFIEKHLPNVTNDRVINELAARAAAIDHLVKLLDNQGVYAGLEPYQKNLMMAALDHLVIGSQGLSIDGCKSCRDRTEVFGAAVKVMMENHKAMSDWKLLERGIIDTLMQGHGFRSVGFHVAAVKASLVHKDFNKGLSKSVQKAIKAYTPFSKALKDIKIEKQKQQVRTSSSGMFGRPGPAKSSSDPFPRRRSLEEVDVQEQKRKGSDPGPGKGKG